VTIAGIYELKLSSEVYFSNQRDPDFEVNINPNDESD
jgi:hypothetical protein